MNLILFEPEETLRPLAASDPRARHLLVVLRRHVGDTFDAGLIDGPHGQGKVRAISADGLLLEFVWGPEPPPLDLVTLIVGLPRPQTARRILHEAAALGVAAVHFARTDKGEDSYAQSTLWTSGEWRRHVRAGAEQAFVTRLPQVTWGRQLADLLPHTGRAIALDNYEAPEPLGLVGLSLPLTIAIGSERGWSFEERDKLRSGGYALAHLGRRVLRTETAAVAAVAIVRSRLGLL